MVWMVSILPLIFSSSFFFRNFCRPFQVQQLQLVLLSPSCSTAFSLVIFFFLVFCQGPNICLSFCFLLISFCGPPKRQNPQDGKYFFFSLIITVWSSGRDKMNRCYLKIAENFTGFILLDRFCFVYLVVWSNFNHLHYSQ